MRAALLSLLALPLAAQADSPVVVTDIAPVHGLVSRVMQGVGEPVLLVQPGASPHDYALRPSDAAALQAADAVVWIGEELTPWLEDPIETLAGDALHLPLLSAEATRRLEFRVGTTFAPHDHDEDHAQGDDHAHDDHAHDDHAHDDHAHDDHAHDDYAGHDHDHEAEGHHDAHGHDHSGVDSHAWLDPENAVSWMELIARQIAVIDPDNAPTYLANAAAGRDEIRAAVQEASDLLSDAHGPFVVFHDAYQYFERSFGLSAAGAISLGDAARPSAARIAEIRDTVARTHVRCAFSEPQFDAGLLKTVLEGSDARIGVLDPLGAGIAPGPDFYPTLLRRMARDMSDCLG